MLNTHYSGRFKKFIDKINEKAPTKFYEIFNSKNFYDVRDENNSLTPEQKASVRTENQKRYTDFSEALAEMFRWYLGDDDEGLVTNSVQEVVDKLDIRSSANAAKTDSIGNAISTVSQGPLAPLQSINIAQQVVGAQVAAAMGSNIFDPDMIPPIGFGLNYSLPGNIANIYKAGFFQPNWDFLYEHEFKSSKFYYTGSGGLKIGTGIDVGAAPSELWLKQIFNVTSVSKDLTPLGDPVGGLTEEDYIVVKRVKDFGIGSSAATHLGDSDIKKFSLNELQLRSCFYKLVDSNLWKPINNRKNWINGHWGSLGHNSCPDYVRTAVASFIWDTGMALEPNKSDESALISYCLQMGIYYSIGFKYRVSVAKIDPDNSSALNIFDDGQNLNDILVGQSKSIRGIPKNKSLAATYFTWIADILSRTTSNINGETIAFEKRKRRMAEANLIYKAMGLPIIEFGTPLENIDYAHKAAGLKDRKFDKLVAATVLRYANEGAPGGTGTNHSLRGSNTNDVNINYGPNAKPESISPYTLRVIKHLFSTAGINSLTITSSSRTPKEQARVMFESLERKQISNYKFAGQQVIKVYEKGKNAGDTGSTIKSDMEAEINKYPSGAVSRHTVKPVEINAIDIAPHSIRPSNKTQILEAILKENEGQGKLLVQFLSKEANDPAFHLLIPQSSDGDIEPLDDALPTVAFSLGNNTNFKSDTAWMAPLAKDRILKEDFEQVS